MTGRTRLTTPLRGDTWVSGLSSPPVSLAYMATEAEIHVEALRLESGSFIQQLTIRFSGLERSIVAYTTKDAGDAGRLAAELQGLLRRLVAAAANP
jgi:hypothetical protein